VARRADYLVLGSGIAALRAALTLAEHGRVLILTKAASDEGNTGWAQGGIAAALGPDDSPDLHGQDTVAAGDGLCEQAAVDVLVDEGRRYVQELLDWGARFDRQADGAPALAREAAHSVRRVLHARDATGREIARVLHERVATTAQVTLIDHARVTSLLIRDGQCAGATWLDRAGQAHTEEAFTTLLATGGAGRVFAETTNPSVTTGDGIAMAFDAGAQVADLEFVQFHPTVLDVSGQPRFLLSEALRGEGAWLLNAAGERFMLQVEPAAELAPRDRVARAIVREQERTGQPVVLSLAHLSSRAVHDRFPLIAEACRQAGLDLACDPIPVSPAVHYVMGGVATDLYGRTSVPGLFAAGEVACTGVHGANRLASNSLLEGLVFGARAGRAMTRPLQTWQPWASGRLAPADVVGVPQAPAAAPPVDDLPRHAWDGLGLIRDAERLDALVALAGAALTHLRGSCTSAGEAHQHSLVTVTFLMARAAQRREESRGGHYRSDFPHRDDDRWLRHCADVRALG
jgi:L-aspartate oxidase